MGALSIIHKNNRTEEDLKEAYRILFKADKSITQHIEYKDILDFNGILDNLRMLSKSRLLKCIYCPHQLKLKYIAKLPTIEEPRIIMIDGKNLHKTDQLFWDTKVSVNDFMNASDIEKMMYRKYMELIPKDEYTKFLDKMAQNFVWFESQRITDILSDLGKTKSVIQEYVFPVCHEVAIENWDLNLMGIIDRIDRMSNDTYCAVEYKYGKPKYIDNDYHATHIKKELGFYGVLPQGKNVYAIISTTDGNHEAIPIKEHLGFKPEFYYGAMLSFQDIVHTRELLKLNIYILNGVKKSIDRYWKRLDTGMFNPLPKNACFEWCEYYFDVCEVNKEWQEIEHIMDD